MGKYPSSIYRLKILIIGLLLLVLATCQSGNLDEKESSFRELYPSTSMNEALELRVWKFDNTLGDERIIDLFIENQSNYHLHFTNNFGARIFTYSETDGRWIEIRDKMTTYGNDIILSPKGYEQLYIRNTAVIPDLPDSIYINCIRIVIHGNAIRDNEVTDEKVGAYIDINLGSTPATKEF